jgi:hypothetical protein
VPAANTFKAWTYATLCQRLLKQSALKGGLAARARL